MVNKPTSMSNIRNMQKYAGENSPCPIPTKQKVIIDE